VEHHVAVPVGAAAEVLAARDIDYEVSVLRRGSDAVATLVIGGRTVAEERWVAGRYHQRSVGTRAVLGDDRWVVADEHDPRLGMLGLGLDELAERGGRDEIDAGVVVELVSQRRRPPPTVAITAPGPSDVVELDDLADAVGTR
jgi:hypothetical protein